MSKVCIITSSLENQVLELKVEGEDVLELNKNDEYDYIQNEMVEKIEDVKPKKQKAPRKPRVKKTKEEKTQPLIKGLNEIEDDCWDTREDVLNRYNEVVIFFNNECILPLNQELKYYKKRVEELEKQLDELHCVDY